MQLTANKFPFEIINLHDLFMTDIDKTLMTDIDKKVEKMMRLVKSKEKECLICLDREPNRGISCCWSKICHTCLYVTAKEDAQCPFCRSSKFYSVILKTDKELNNFCVPSKADIKFSYSTSPLCSISLDDNHTIDSIMDNISEIVGISFNNHLIPDARMEYYLRIGDKELVRGHNFSEYHIFSSTDSVDIIIGERRL